MPDVAPDALLVAATDDCLAEVALVDKGAVACTHDGVSVMDGDKEPTHNLWVCNGAVMPERVQRCLSGARDSVNAGGVKPAVVVEEAVEP